MKIKFWGTRGSIPVPGRDTIEFGGNTTCVEVTLESGRSIVIDAGTGIRAMGEYLCEQSEKIDIHLLITHIHWDHILGFPFFAPIYKSTSHIAIDGFPTCMRGLRIPFDNRMVDGFFPVKFNDLKAEIHYLDRLRYGPLTVDGTTIEGISLQHPQGGYGFRFREGEKTLVFITDNELPQDPARDSHLSRFIDFCKGADILIHDAQYTPAEMPYRKGWGHSDYISTLDLAFEADAGKLILFHHDPVRTDTEVASIEAHCKGVVGERGAGTTVAAAREGIELAL